ncbi:hypothetical protein [Bdellovibrio bacteriovorus]|uniref:Uncharacterized protein n=1 Tax=Bdellovibrio bacteriovorus TaxID=959 RepID=A0A150WE92_BDEBC|nr:hypothetical protein [Bdellovibrio bacteriovorus]KYG61231.1 hypothetical protein AZI85_09830 [Bdellovibrio bacteriovorus]KYG65261.1 hypothetical protein AZI87_11945 [Bdellovibrio bacteriovorus]
MKKQVLVTIIAMIPAVSFAKISDFNALISENVKAQGELHSTVKGNIDEARDQAAAAQVRERIVVVENSGVSYNSPTKKDLLAFKKEKRSHRASESKQFERLASEISSAE